MAWLGLSALRFPLVAEVAVDAVEILLCAVAALFLLAAPLLFYAFFAAVTHGPLLP
jgi:hypothetical protein